jgi:hypothetical protein
MYKMSSLYWLSCLGPLVFLLQKPSKIFDFPIFRLCAYTIKVIPKMRRLLQIFIKVRSRSSSIRRINRWSILDNQRWRGLYHRKYKYRMSRQTTSRYLNELMKIHSGCRMKNNTVPLPLIFAFCYVCIYVGVRLH